MQNHGQVSDQTLMRVRRQRRHDINSFPNFVVLINPQIAPLLDELPDQVLVQYQELLGHLRLREKGPYFGTSRTFPGTQWLARNLVRYAHFPPSLFIRPHPPKAKASGRRAAVSVASRL